MRCGVLCYAMLCCAVLCCAVLCCACCACLHVPPARVAIRLPCLPPLSSVFTTCLLACLSLQVHEPKKSFYKKFLYEPFPVESSLPDQLADHFNAEVVAGGCQTSSSQLGSRRDQLRLAPAATVTASCGVAAPAVSTRT